MVLCGADFRGEQAMRAVLGEYDMRHSISLLLLSDQSPADKLPWKWAMELKVPKRRFWADSRRTTYKLAWMKRDVEIFEVGQPDVVIAFRGEATKVGDRYRYVLELAKKYGVPVKRFVSKTRYGKSLIEVKDEES